MAECIEGHITIIADFGMLRTQASVRCALSLLKSHRGVSGTKGQIEGHSTITAGFGTLRTQASVRCATQASVRCATQASVRFATQPA
jgi:hypothetical protein